MKKLILTTLFACIGGLMLSGFSVTAPPPPDAVITWDGTTIDVDPPDITGKGEKNPVVKWKVVNNSTTDDITVILVSFTHESTGHGVDPLRPAIKRQKNIRKNGGSKTITTTVRKVDDDYKGYFKYTVIVKYGANSKEDDPRLEIMK